MKCFRWVICLAIGCLTPLPIAAQTDGEAAAAPLPGIQFEEPVRLTAGGAPIQLEQPGFACPSWADMDGDGLKDLLVGQFLAGKIQVFRNLGKQGLAAGEWLEADGKIAEIPGVWCCTSSTPQVVDLNGDGYPDILSGSYSRQTSDMAGIFQVLWGTEDGFRVAEPLKGTDNKPLIIPAGKGEHATKICTRPFAADIDGDGDLDLIVGNFAGTFFLFTGEGEGRFLPEPTKMMAGDQALRVAEHSDPCLFDWDGDGDLDIISGAIQGGVSVAINVGDARQPRFAQFRQILPGIKRDFSAVHLGDDHIQGPQGYTRVWVDDINGDGKFDLLVGDAYTVASPAEGVAEDEAIEKLKVWSKKQQELMDRQQELSRKITRLSAAATGKEAGQSETSEDSELASLQKQLVECENEMSGMYAKRVEIIQEEFTGSVWVYYQK